MCAPSKTTLSLWRDAGVHSVSSAQQQAGLRAGPATWLFRVEQARALLGRLGRHWDWFAFFGVSSLVLGVVALVWPGATLLVLVVVFAVQLVISGVFRLVGAVVYDDASAGTRALLAILGLLGC